MKNELEKLQFFHPTLDQSCVCVCFRAITVKYKPPAERFWRRSFIFSLFYTWFVL